MKKRILLMLLLVTIIGVTGCVGRIDNCYNDGIATINTQNYRWLYSTEIVSKIIEDFLFENYLGFFTYELMYNEQSVGFDEVDGVIYEIFNIFTAIGFSILTPRDVVECMPRIHIRFADAGGAYALVYIYLEGKYQFSEICGFGRPHYSLYDEFQHQIVKSIQHQLWPNINKLPCGLLIDTDIDDVIVSKVLEFIYNEKPYHTVISIRNSLIRDDLLRIEIISNDLLHNETMHWSVNRYSGEERHWIELYYNNGLNITWYLMPTSFYWPSHEPLNLWRRVKLTNGGD